jgi:hypothetical protein
MTTAKAKPAPRVRPKLNKPKVTTVDKVSFTRSFSTSFKASPQWSTATELQGAVTSWNTTADALEANAATITLLRDQLRTAMLTRRSQLQQWGIETTHVVSCVTVLAGGDAEVLHGLGVEAVLPSAHVALAVPGPIVIVPGSISGQAKVTWTSSADHHGYVLQHASDVANAATISNSVVCTKRRFLLTGALAASVVHVRVAAIDPSSPTGQTEWSEWFAGSVR